MFADQFDTIANILVVPLIVIPCLVGVFLLMRICWILGKLDGRIEMRRELREAAKKNGCYDDRKV